MASDESGASALRALSEGHTRAHSRGIQLDDGHARADGREEWHKKMRRCENAQHCVAILGYSGLGHLCRHCCVSAQHQHEDTMRPNILSSLIDTIQTHVGFTHDLSELQQMRDDIVSSREAIKPSVLDRIRQNREARAAMYDALIALIDVQIAKYSNQ
jgi:hypothetical protein